MVSLLEVSMQKLSITQPRRSSLVVSTGPSTASTNRNTVVQSVSPEQVPDAVYVW